MPLLALETSSEFLSVAVAEGDDVHVFDAAVGNRHSELVLPTVTRLCTEAAVPLSSLEAIAFGAGPGAFTGLRIACGVAQGLAYGLGIPLVAVDAFEALAERYAGAESARVLVAIDARMNEVYAAALERRERRWHYLFGPLVGHPDALPDLIDGPCAAVGNAFVVHRAPLEHRYGPGRFGTLDSSTRPTAPALIAAARRKVAQGDLLDPAHAAPLYVRDRVARTVEERRAVRGVVR